MQAKTKVQTDKTPTITREMLERRVELLERINRANVINAGQFGKHAAKIGALAQSEATLDEKCIEWVCACPPEEWDEVDAQLSDSREPAAAH